MTSKWQIGFLLVTCAATGQAGRASSRAEGVEQGGHHDGHILDDYAEPNYQYRYGVADRKTGDVKGAWEKRAGDAVWGAYWLRDADGYWRTVHYNADKNGFKAVVKRRPLVHLAPLVQTKQQAPGPPGRQEEYPDVSWEDVVRAVRQDEAAKAAKHTADKQLEKLLGPAWNEVDADSLGFDRPDWLEPKGKSEQVKVADDLQQQQQQKQPDIDGKEMAWATDSDGEKVPISVTDDLKTDDVDSWIGPLGDTKKGAAWFGRPIHVQEGRAAGRAPARQGKESTPSSGEAGSGREPVPSKWHDAVTEVDGEDLPRARTAAGSGNAHKGSWHRAQALRSDDKGPWSRHKGEEKRGSWSSLSGKDSAAKGEHSAWTESKVQKTASVKSPNDGLLIWPDRKAGAPGAVHTWAAVGLPALPQAGYSHGKESPELSFSGWTPMQVTPRPHVDFEGQKRLALPPRKKETPDGTSLWPKGKRNKYIAHDKGSKSVNKDGRSVKSEGKSEGVITVGSDNDDARANYFWHTRWA